MYFTIRVVSKVDLLRGGVIHAQKCFINNFLKLTGIHYNSPQLRVTSPNHLRRRYLQLKEARILTLQTTAGDDMIEREVTPRG